MKPKFREDKTTQAAALFIKLNKEPLDQIKLMKLLYFAEREALNRWKRPITFDSYVSMQRGPVLSETLDLIHEEDQSDSIWHKFISPPQNYKLSLINDPGTDKLSQAEEDLIKEIFLKYGHINKWILCEMSHDLREWQDPKGSVIPIAYSDIFEALGKTKIEIDAIISELENIALMDEYIG
jgi:uncharacterized phage-associated protein